MKYKWESGDREFWGMCGIEKSEGNKEEIQREAEGAGICVE